MKIILPGGTGQIGRMLARAFQQDDHEVVVLSRGTVANAPYRVVPWDARTLGGWAKEFEGADVVINLAGRSINCRYTPANLRALRESRMDSTRIVGQAIRKAAHPPRVWLQASTATIYAHRSDAPNDELTGLMATAETDAPKTWQDILAVATAWEQAATEGGPLPHTRQVLLRTSIMMSPVVGGAFEVMLGLVRHGLGGRAGDGRQYISWINDRDFLRAIRWLIGRDTLAGPVNLASPGPLPNAEFMQGLREAWGISFGLPASGLVLEAGAFFMRTETELILKSRRVVPTRLLQDGFKFEFPHWPEAARDLCARWQAARGKG
jgi:uncharacterized protein (TIGR01777 family)